MCLRMRRKQSPEKIPAMIETTNKASRKTMEFSKFQHKGANSRECIYFHYYTKNRHFKNGTEGNKTSNSQ